MTDKFAPGWILTSCVAIALTVLLWLGFWQLDRLDEKTAFLAQIDVSLKGEPEAFPDFVDEISTWEYRKVEIKATVMGMEALCIFGRNTEGVMGLYHIVPVMLEGGQQLLVNSGWSEVADLGKLACSSIKTGSHSVTMVGVVRLPNEKNFATPPANIEDRIWYTLDIESKAKAAGLENLLPAILDNVTLGGRTYDTYMPLSVPNDHMQYALTWFGLSVMLIGVYIAFGMQRARKND